MTASPKRMSDRNLLRLGEAARYMCLPAANHGKEPRRVFAIQLTEAEEGHRRRATMNCQTCAELLTDYKAAVGLFKAAVSHRESSAGKGLSAGC